MSELEGVCKLEPQDNPVLTKEQLQRQVIAEAIAVIEGDMAKIQATLNLLKRLTGACGLFGGDRRP